jgi:biotin carboxyl carrier protein
MKRDVIVSGESAAVELHVEGCQVRANVNGRSYMLEAQETRPGVYWFNWNGRSLEVAVQGAIASIQGRSVPVELVDPRRRFQRGHSSHEGVVEVRAPMPGKIVRVLRKESTAVEANEGLVVMEAMKMQNEVRSPKKGIVRSLLVAEGSAVNAGDPIALVE